MQSSTVKAGAVAAFASLAVAGTAALVPSTASSASPRLVVTAASMQRGMVQPMSTSPTAYGFGETLSRLDGRRLEVTFLAGIIGHHRAAIEMAQLEVQRGTDPDIRTHAQNIIASQRHQVAQFTQWLKQWYGLTPEQAMRQVGPEAQREIMRMDRQSQQDLADLRKTSAGRGFDLQFVRMIIAHHTAGIIEFLEPQARAMHAQLRVAASSGITTQEAEVADFRTWLSGQAGQGS